MSENYPSSLVYTTTFSLLVTGPESRLKPIMSGILPKEFEPVQSCVTEVGLNQTEEKRFQFIVENKAFSSP